MFENLLFLGGFFIGGIIVSLITNKLLLNFSESLGIRNKNDVVVRWSNQSKPSLGGVSFYVVFIFSTIAYSIFSEEYIFHESRFIGLLLAGSLAFGMGLADDAYNTKPLIKLSIQILCGVIFVYSGTVIEMTHNHLYDSILTVCWVVILMNSLNMLDNMDGITGTTVFFILSASLVSVCMISGISHGVYSILLVSVIGSIMGFLYYNVHPSKLFMGDAGSQFISLFVAYITVHDLWNTGLSTNTPSWVGFAICLVAFTPAASDTLTVVINRLRKGKSPMVGGKDHTTHHLVYAGLNDRKVWYVFTGIGFVSAVLTILMIHLSLEKILFPIAILSIFFFIVFGFLYSLTLKYKQPTPKND